MSYNKEIHELLARRSTLLAEIFSASKVKGDQMRYLQMKIQFLDDDLEIALDRWRDGSTDATGIESPENATFFNRNETGFPDDPNDRSDYNSGIRRMA